MSDKLVFTEDVANEALRAVRLTNARLASAQSNADTYAEAAGHRELSRAIRGSASSWRINRDRLSERLTSVGDAVDGVTTTLKAIDDAFAAGMAAASQPSSDAVSSSPSATGGGGSVSGEAPQHIAEPNALATPGAPAGALGGGSTTAPVVGPVPEAPAGASPEGSPPVGSDVSPPPEATDPGKAPWGPGALLPTMPSGSEQQQLRAVLGEFAAQWESVTGTPPEGVIALLGLLGAAGAGAAAASGSRASAPPAAGGDSTSEGPGGGGVASVPSPGSSDATTGEVGSTNPGTPGEPGTDNQPRALGDAGSDAALVDADEVPAGVGGADTDPASAESGVEGNVTPPQAEVPERVPELVESVGTSGSDGAAPSMADLPELGASPSPSVLPDLPTLDAAAQPPVASAAPGLAGAPDLPSLDAAAQPAGSSTASASSLPSLEADPGLASELSAAPQGPLVPLDDGAQSRAAGAMPMGPMSPPMPKPAPASGGGLGMSGSGTPPSASPSSPGPTSSSPGSRDVQVLVADEPSSTGLDTDDEPEKVSAPGE
jgi:hypothetical protein